MGVGNQGSVRAAVAATVVAGAGLAVAVPQRCSQRCASFRVTAATSPPFLLEEAVRCMSMCREGFKPCVASVARMVASSFAPHPVGP